MLGPVSCYHLVITVVPEKKKVLFKTLINNIEQQFIDFIFVSVGNNVHLTEPGGT